MPNSRIPVSPIDKAGNINHNHASHALIDHHFRCVAAGVVIAFIILVIFCYAITPRSECEYLTGSEQAVAQLGFILLLIPCLSKILPVFVVRSKKPGSHEKNGQSTENAPKWNNSAASGIIVLTIAIQGVAMVTYLLMSFFPVPMRVDPVLGTRVHLLRWCEWPPLGYAMTFMTEAMDLHGDAGDALKVSHRHALVQGLSTIGGLFFPFCLGLKTWGFVMIISWGLFLYIFPRLSHKRLAFKSLKAPSGEEEREIYNRTMYSYQLLVTCAFMWSLLIVVFFFEGLAPFLVDAWCVYKNENANLDGDTLLCGSAVERFLKDPSLTIFCETTMDVILKILYLNIVLEIHYMVFDDGLRSERRLNELRLMMNVVWESSSDVIAISVRAPTSGDITTMVSPTYLKLFDVKRNYLGNKRDKKADKQNTREGEQAMVFELDAEEISMSKNKQNTNDCPGDLASLPNVSPDLLKGPRLARSRSISFEPPANTENKNTHRRIVPKNAYSVNFSKGITNIKEGLQNSSNDNNSRALPTEVISSMANLTVRAWGSKGTNVLLMHKFICFDERLDEETEAENRAINCEANVTRLDENSLVVVIRDVSERVRRFEIEKQLVSETTARLKDAEANRFTKHEVKNGLFAAISLCDSLRDAHNLSAMKNLSLDNYQTSRPSSEGKLLSELDKTLHEVLDTILAETMARDVIHEVYEPNIERVNINALMSGSGGLNEQSDRYSLVTEPSPMPMLMLDQQLLKYIYRNAISNAYKYGKKLGVISTSVSFDERTGLFSMSVINLPGENHQKIIEMGDRAKEVVFSPGSRLSHISSFKENDTTLVSHSSGDGAWIMRKCARTLGGDCDIEFESERTVFLFSCPAKTFEDVMKVSSSRDQLKFYVPPESWGIAIDDSKVQRKLLQRFLKSAGVSESRTIVQGETAAEIHNFDTFVTQLIDQHPNDYFLVIADENLDIEDSMHCVTVSGSLSIQSIRRQILPEQERRLLCLVRSANDSTEDVAIYTSRAHGFLPKAPLRKENIIETLAILWGKKNAFT